MTWINLLSRKWKKKKVYWGKYILCFPKLCFPFEGNYEIVKHIINSSLCFSQKLELLLHSNSKSMLLLFPSVKALLSFLILLYYQQNLPRVRNHTAHPAFISAKSRQHWLLSLQYPKHRSEKLPVAIPFLFNFFPLHFTKKQQQLQEQLSGRVLYMLTWKLISNSNPNQQAVKKAIVSQVQQTFLPHQ